MEDTAKPEAGEQSKQPSPMPGGMSARLNAAIRDIGGKVAKDKENTQDRYRYASADAIIELAGQSLAAHGVTVEHEIAAQSIVAVEYTSSKGSVAVRYDARLDMLYYLTDEDGNCAVRRWVGYGSDYRVPEKAAYKASTSGEAYFLKRLLKIAADNEDGEHEPREATFRPTSTPREAYEASQRVSQATKDAIASAQRPAAPAPTPQASPGTLERHEVCPGGRDKGRAWRDCETGSLEFWGRKALEGLHHERFGEANAMSLRRINAELTRRNCATIS